jgi:hypothetical protein
MKRLLFVSAVFCGAALIPLAAQAQRGGAHGGFGGGHVGGAVSHGGAGFSGAGARIGGVRPTGGVRPVGVGRPIGATRPVGLRTGGTRSHVFSPAQRGNFSHSRFSTNRFRNHFEEDEDDRFHHRNRFFNDCFNGFGGFGGFGCFNPFFGGLGFGTSFFDPFLFGDYGQQQQQPQQQPVAVQPDESANRELAFEVQAIQDEIQALRSEERAREQARTPPPPPKTTVEEERGVTLVFRDGRQLPVHNYAVADHTIWVLGPNVARKIPASDLDLDATEQVNAKNGVEFHVPH